MKHRCTDVRALAGDLADPGVLTREARATLDAHLAECPDCVAELKGTVVQRAWTAAVYEDVAPAPLPEALVARCVAAMKQAADEARPGSGARTA